MNTYTPLRIQKERTHIFSPSITIAMLGIIQGDVSDHDLGAAIAAAVSNHEILSCKITFDEQGEAFYEKIEQPRIHIEPFDRDWKAVVQDQETIAFDWVNGELIRFFVKRQQDSFQLLILAHHLTGDGLAVSYLLNDVLHALNGDELIYKRLQLFDPKTVPPRSKLPPWMRIILHGLNRKWNSTGKAFNYTEYQEMYQSYWSSRTTKIYCKELNESQLSALKETAKRQGITINSLLTTAFAKSAQGHSDIGLAVSVRPKNYRGMGNYATGISIRYRYNKTHDFGANAHKVHKRIYKKLNNHKAKFFLLQFMNEVSPTLIDAAYFSAYGGYVNKAAHTVSNLFGYGVKPKSISITNLTTLDIHKSQGKYSLTAVSFVPPLVPNARRIVGICTFEDRLTLSLHVAGNDLLSEEKDFWESALRELTFPHNENGIPIMK
ncbi:hypothetical protein [Paenibacillus sp. FSL R7-0179]|uniref:hypothetical protein n=1 Tax=Paenibacillus sp. FSL R7-0179 TaxID=2921672 RepID=UPI0030F4DEAF